MVDLDLLGVTSNDDIAILLNLLVLGLKRLLCSEMTHFTIEEVDAQDF